MLMATSKKRVLPRFHCNDCHGKTLHKLLKATHDADSEDIEERYTIWWDTLHEMFECCGCKSVVLRRTHQFSEWEYPDVRFFPPRTSRHKPKWLFDIPYNMKLLLEEIYNSLDADTTALPLMGARALLDMIMVDKVGDVGSFAQKLKALEAQGFISRKNRETLEVALDAGSAAAHRGYSAKLDDVQAVMDIVENLLQATYVFDKVTAALKKSTPPRPPRKA
jgi:Domain of unknown function (DUF4145)